MTPPMKTQHHLATNETPVSNEICDDQDTSLLVLEPGTFRTCHPTGKRAEPTALPASLPDEVLDQLLKEADRLFAGENCPKQK